VYVNILDRTDTRKPAQLRESLKLICGVSEHNKNKQLIDDSSPQAARRINDQINLMSLQDIARMRFVQPYIVFCFLIAQNNPGSGSL
jgi:hypothetical protein